MRKSIGIRTTVVILAAVGIVGGGLWTAFRPDTLESSVELGLIIDVTPLQGNFSAVSKTMVRTDEAVVVLRGIHSVRLGEPAVLRRMASGRVFLETGRHVYPVWRQ